MFFSLIQTLVCVLLVNGGLYALHLTGSSSSANQNGSPGSASSANGHSAAHSGATTQMKNPPSSATNPFQTTSTRLNQELADLAQLERERLMVMGLAKQTAEESGYHGRPIITGRIKMHPAEEIDPDYSNWLTQQAHNVMFGSVVKQPIPGLLNDDAEEDYDAAGGGGGGGGTYGPPRRSSKYDYGRVVQPAERDFENPHTLDLDDFMELESVAAADEEEMFPDLDGYAYIDELMADENKERVQHQQTHHQNVPQFPGFTRQQVHHQVNPYARIYQNPEHMDTMPETLQELFEKEKEHRQQIQQKQQQQHDVHQQMEQQQQQQQMEQQQQQQMEQQQLHQMEQQHHQMEQQQHQQMEQQQHQQMEQQHHQMEQHHQQQQQQFQFNPKYRNNIRLQQKWQSKRAQMQQQHQQMSLPRNIFGQKNKQQQPHFFKTQSTNKLSLANSEATATSKVHNKHIGEKPQQQQQQQQQQQSQQSQHQQEQSHNDNQPDGDKNIVDMNKSEKSAFWPSSSVSAIGEQQKPDQILNPNHKRSGVGSSASLSSPGMPPVSPHSLASQLMLRTARGQRQYDVPQIGAC